jgi:hypothetical protein
MAGRQANICVDSYRILQHTYGQFGMRADLRAVELVVADTRGEILHHAREPSWQGNMLDEHCIVCLPDDHRFVDATAEQYRHVAHVHLGLVVGRLAGSLETVAGEHGAFMGGGRLPAGAQIVMQRQSLTLEYILATDAATQVILSHPCVHDNVEAHRRAGINPASLTVDFLGRSGFTERARGALYPRLHALLDAIGGTPAEVDDWRFSVAGRESQRARPADPVRSSRPALTA